jgi:hypothetical protein
LIELTEEAANRRRPFGWLFPSKKSRAS